MIVSQMCKDPPITPITNVSTPPLQALPGKLTLHEADLLKDGSFDEVVKVSASVACTC